MMLRFFSLFILIQMSLFTLSLWHPVQQIFILPWTQWIAQLSVTLMRLFDSSVLVDGVVIYAADQSFAVAIRAGCNGIEAGIILAAAIFAFPRTNLWLKLIGFVIGFLTIQGLNLLRIISLYYLGQWDVTLFEWAHLYVWEVLIMLDVLIVFLLWLRYLKQKETYAAPTANDNATPEQVDNNKALRCP